MARGLKFWIKEAEGLYNLCSKNKAADQLRICKNRFLMTWLVYSSGAWLPGDIWPAVVGTGAGHQDEMARSKGLLYSSKNSIKGNALKFLKFKCSC